METGESSSTLASKLGSIVEDRIESQNGTLPRQNRVMTALVPKTLFEEFNSKRKKQGKSISELQREMIRDWLAIQKDLEISATNLSVRQEDLRQRIKSRSDKIHHMDAYMNLFREQGGDTNEFKNAETTLEAMRPAVDAFQERKIFPDEIEFCDPCMDEAHHDFVADRHLEIDWLRFRDYVLFSKEYCKLTRKPTEV